MNGLIRRIASIDGQDVPLTECDWLHIAPCGCACGIAMAELRGSDHIIADEELAHLEFTVTRTQREVKRNEEAGFTVRLIRHAEFQANRDILAIHCPHEPEWGVEPIPTPEGYAWAVDTSSWQRRPKTKHLVRERGVYRGDWRAYAEVPSHERAPLCQRATHRPSWSADSHVLDVTLECSRCVKAGRALPPPSRQETAQSGAAS